ncbi:MAG: sel1 repeat family protein [Desulfobacula sp.]|nr:sel1 repeat family protein [Desulfobacula sp.]
MKRFLLLIAASAFFFSPGCFSKNVPTADYKRASYWSIRNAEKGSASAQNMLGSMYYLGEGVPRDLKKAYAWYKLAANQGDSSAQKFLDIITALLPADQLKEAQTLFLSKNKKIIRSK